MVDILQRVLSHVLNCATAVWRKFTPFAEVPPTLVDAVRSRRELLVENALLRHQIVGAPTDGWPVQDLLPWIGFFSCSLPVCFRVGATPSPSSSRKRFSAGTAWA